MTPLEHIIQDSVALGTVRTLELLGVSACELSQRKALKLYGKWFKDACENGDLRPIRIEEGRTGARIYRIEDILAVRVRDAAKAELRLPREMTISR